MCRFISSVAPVGGRQQLITTMKKMTDASQKETPPPKCDDSSHPTVRTFIGLVVPFEEAQIVRGVADQLGASRLMRETLDMLEQIQTLQDTIAHNDSVLQERGFFRDGEALRVSRDSKPGRLIVARLQLFKAYMSQPNVPHPRLTEKSQRKTETEN
jgi:hypothetical protein